MGHIFISYSHKDTDYAHGLASNLQSAGFEVWIDARIDYGSQWPHEIQRQLDACDAFILIMTPRSFQSEWVQSELQRAKRKLKPIFPLLLEGDEPWLSVESTQYFDVRGEKFPDAWFYSALKRVVSTRQNAPTFVSLKKSIKTEPTASPPAPKHGIEITIAIIGTLATIFAACATVVVGLFSSPIMERFLPGNESPNTLLITGTLALNPSLTYQPILPASPILSPAETLMPTLPPPPTSAPVVVKPTLAPPIPTAIPMLPSPAGRWTVTANQYEGELNIITINNGYVSGTVFDNSIEGSWNEDTQEITFTRVNSSDPNIYQVYYGEQLKQGNKYIIAGSFEDHDAYGNVEWYDWTAER